MWWMGGMFHILCASDLVLRLKEKEAQPSALDAYNHQQSSPLHLTQLSYVLYHQKVNVAQWSFSLAVPGHTF